MKHIVLILFLFVTSFTIAQSLESKSSWKEGRFTCNLNLTIDELIKNELKFNCITHSDQSIQVSDFKIKFKGHPTQVIKGEKLNSKALNYAKNSKTNDYITIFDIKNLIINSEIVKAEEPFNILIKIIN